MSKKYLYQVLSEQKETFLPSVSVDCVILGFHEGEVKILLSRFMSNEKWMLPGGFVFKDENVDDAAYRILKERTRLNKIYLTQFYLFGDANRVDMDENQMILQKNEFGDQDSHWLLNRFVSVGYYALVDFSKVKVGPDEGGEVGWFNLNEVPALYIDHNAILDKAIRTIRRQLGYIPIGYQMLPEKFTMSELRVIYESILGKPIDRRNFQRRMLSSGLVVQLDEISKKWGVKKTALFSFNKDRYNELMEDGMLML